MFEMWVLRMRAMTLSSIAVNQERKQRPRRGRLGVTCRMIGCEILTDIQIEVSVSCWKLGSETQAEGWLKDAFWSGCDPPGGSVLEDNSKGAREPEV